MRLLPGEFRNGCISRGPVPMGLRTVGKAIYLLPFQFSSVPVIDAVAMRPERQRRHPPDGLPMR